MIRPTGVPLSTRTFLGAPPTPRLGVGEAKDANPGRGKRAAGTRSAVAKAMADLITGPPKLQRRRVGCLKSEQGYERVRRCRVSGRDAAHHFVLRCARDTRARQPAAASREEPTFTCGRIRSIVSGLLFTMKTATRTCEPSARGAMRRRGSSA